MQGMKWLIKWSIIVIVPLLAIGFIFNLGIQGMERLAASANESAKTAEPAPEETKPTKEAPKLTPEQELTAAIQKVARDAEVKFLDDTIQITAPYVIVTKKMSFSATQVDVVDTLDAISKSDLLTDDMEVQFHYMGELVDKLGNESTSEVIGVGYSAKLIKQINFPNFLIDNIYDVADRGVFIHPAIR